MRSPPYFRTAGANPRYRGPCCVRSVRIRSRARGAAMTEYAVVVGVVALACVTSFVGLGVSVVRSFEATRDLLLFPSP